MLNVDPKYGHLKIAIVHDWLPVIGGGERVVAEMVKAFPNADIYTLFNFLSDEQLKSLGIRSVQTSFLNKLPMVRKYYRHLLPIIPLAIEDFDLQKYDLVLTSSAAFSKGVITGANQLHVSYVHSPARYAWEMMHLYLRQSNLDKGLKGYLTKYLLSRFRIWDYRTANGVDYFIANSNYISRRIHKVYRRKSEVIYPPVNLEEFSFTPIKENYFLTASRMVPYKRMDLIVAAFAKMPQCDLVVIGDGPERQKLQSLAQGCSNIRFLGYVENSDMIAHMQKAKAFVFAAEEDFGIVPVEAQACGTPVLAFGAGGTLETVIDYNLKPDAASGLFFMEQTVESIQDAVMRFLKLEDVITPKNCRLSAERFSPEVFRNKLTNAVDQQLKLKSENMHDQ